MNGLYSVPRKPGRNKIRRILCLESQGGTKSDAFCASKAREASKSDAFCASKTREAQNQTHSVPRKPGRHQNQTHSVPRKPGRHKIRRILCLENQGGTKSDAFCASKTREASKSDAFCASKTREAQNQTQSVPRKPGRHKIRRNLCLENQGGTKSDVQIDTFDLEMLSLKQKSLTRNESSFYDLFNVSST